MTLRSYKVDAAPACAEDEASVEDRSIADAVLEPERDRLDHHPRMEDFVRQGIRKGGEHLWLLTVFLVSLCTTYWRICSRGDLNSNEWPCSRDIGHI